MKKKRIINIALLLIGLLFVFLAYRIFGSYDFIKVMKWYGMLLLMGFAGYPITYFFFKKFHDNGYIFSKIIGILLTGFLMWLLSSLHILKFNTINAFICVSIVIIISYLILFIKKKKDSTSEGFLDSLKNKSSYIFRTESVFLIILLISAYVKGFNPAAHDLEKFMDYGYMSIMDKSDYMPSMDMWFAGEKINYYYFGQYVATFLTKVSNVGVNYGFNLMFITLFSLCIMACYSIGYNLILSSKLVKDKSKSYLPIFGGILAALAVVCASNMHYIIYGIILPIFRTYFGFEMSYEYYYADSTRYIGHFPLNENDQTIHEFPSYSFIVGDLHAHVLNMIFVLLLLGLLITFIIKRKGQKEEYFKMSNLLNPYLLIIGFLLGIYKMTNYWDFPIYLVVSIAIFAFVNITKYSKVKDIIKATLFEAMTIFMVAMLTSIPFVLNFDMISSNIAASKYHTPIVQFAVLWLLPIIMVSYFIYHHIKDYVSKKEEKSFLKYFKEANISDMFTIIIGLCAIGLIFIPEFIYVRDIYGDGYDRANTMFKLVFQAFIMFGICYSYIIISLIVSKDKKKRKKGIIFLVLILIMSSYLFKYVTDNSFFNYRNYKTLDGSAFLKTDVIYDDENDAYTITNDEGKKETRYVYMADDWNMITYLNKNAKSDTIILEGSGYSYTFADRISVFTGLATPLGWETHEYLWRSKNSYDKMPASVQERMDDVELIYTSANADEVRKLINKYNISYIIVGYSERKRYGTNDLELYHEDVLKSMGKVVFETYVNNFIPTSYIIKVK